MPTDYVGWVVLSKQDRFHPGEVFVPGAEPFILGGDTGVRDNVTAIHSPYDRTVVAEVCYADEADAEQACALASQAFRQTRQFSSHERSAILLRVADKLNAETQFLAELVMREAGKPISDARNEVTRAVETFRVAAEEAKRIGGEVTPADLTAGNEGRMAFTRRFPIGPILGITPFNFPVNLVAHKLAPAIASGNPIILKPAPQTPMSSLWLGRAVLEAGWPEGAISVLPCSNEVAAKMVADKRIAMLSFTGSASIGWMLRKQAATPRVTLELGGNAAVIVCEDADLGKAITKIAGGGFTYAGQSCISVQRVFVHRSLKDRLIRGIVDGISMLRCGDPADVATRLGPMINEAAAIRAEGWIDEAVRLGATLHAGGGRTGCMLQATLLSDVPVAAQLSCEEAFAPVVVVEAFEDFDQVLESVNKSRYGLQAALFTNDWKKMTQAWNELEVGAILVDESSAWRAEHLPYGGVKDSGYGKEGVRSALLEMTEPRILIAPVEFR
jgi:acyl-CoA reductase-like NAD-dependent aldehyde dehydrogenase